MNKAFNKAFAEVAAKLLTVEQLNEPVKQAARMTTCVGCEFFIPEDKVCGDCGCYMEKKTPLFTNRNPKKLGRIEVTHCPLGKWGKHDRMIANIYRLIDGKDLLKN